MAWNQLGVVAYSELRALWLGEELVPVYLRVINGIVLPQL